MVLAVWAFNLIGSSLWLRYFNFGPLEWCWRSLTYWKRQPMRIHRPAPEQDFRPPLEAAQEAIAQVEIPVHILEAEPEAAPEAAPRPPVLS